MSRAGNGRAEGNSPAAWARTLGDRLTDAGLGAVLRIARSLPYERRVPFMGRAVARVLGPMAGFPRRIRANLSHVWPDLPQHEVERLVAAVSDNVGRTMAELFSPDEFRAHALAARVGGEGIAVLDEVIATGRPLIGVSGHFGNYDAGRVFCQARGLRVGALYRPLRNPFVNRRYVAAISALGSPLFEQNRRGMARMVRHLREGGSVAVLTDLHVWRGVPLDFLGRPAMTSTVIPELALRHEVPLVPIFAHRLENGLDFEIEIEAPITPSSPEAMAQEINDRLAAQVHRHPEQWFWIHRRWKRRKGQPGRIAAAPGAEDGAGPPPEAPRPPGADGP